MIHKKSITRTLFIALIIGAIIPLILAIYFTVLQTYSNHNETISILRENCIDKQKDTLHHQINKAFQLIKSERTFADNQNLKHPIDEKELKNIILEKIGKIRFGKDGYIFVVSFDGVTLMNDTQRELIGKNIWNLEDPNGVKVIQEERKAVENPEGDFIYYMWNKPNKSTPSHKISFIKGVHDWQWMVGTGVYEDEINNAITQQKTILYKNVKKQLYLITLFFALIFAYILLISKLFSVNLKNNFRVLNTFFEKSEADSSLIDLANFNFPEFIALATSANKMITTSNLAKKKIVEKSEQLKIEFEKSENQRIATLSILADLNETTANLKTEIEKHKQAKNRLEISQKRLIEAQHIALLGRWDLDITNNSLHWSDSIFEIFEIDKENFNSTYEAFINLIHPDDREMVKLNYRKSLKSRKICDIMHRILMKDGRIKWVLQKCSTQYDTQGNPLLSVGIIQDITKQKIIQKKLSAANLNLLAGEQQLNAINQQLEANNKQLIESESKYRLLAENTSDIIWVYNLSQDKFTYISPSVLQVRGFTVEEAMQNSLIKIIKDDSKSSMKSIISKRLEDFKNGIQQIYQDELQLICKDGSYIWAEIVTNLYLSEKNELVIQGISRNITARKIVEEKNLKLSTAVTQSPSIVVITNTSGNIEYVNPKFTKLTGYSFEEVKGKNPRILNSHQQSKNTYKDLWKTVTSGKDWCGIFHNKKKNGELFWEAATISPIFDKAGKITNYLKVAEDITERKQIEESLKKSEEKLRLAIDNSPIGFSATNLKGIFTDVNNAMCKMIGYSKEEMIGNHFDKFSHPDDIGANKIVYDKLVVGEIPSFDLEKRYIHKNGKIINVLIRGQLIKDNAGNPSFEVAIVEDITKRKIAEAEIKKNLREKETLLQELYHRTKNNMAVISAMLSIQSKSTKDEFVITTFKEIINKIKAMSLVHQKLYQAKDLSNINLKDYIIDMVKMLKQSYDVKRKNITFQLDLEDINILIDSAIPLGLVMNELISNIFKHAFQQDKGGIITIRIYQTKDKFINILLSDNGVGIPKKMNLRKSNSMGLRTIFSIVELQLKGSIDFDITQGLRWHLIIKNNLHKERI